MKVIVSHDVDHLFRSDHFKDLIYPKLWVRSTIECLSRKYSTKEWFCRMINPFFKTRHHIFDVIDIDRRYNIPSTFFFGMKNGLGMAYHRVKAIDVIKSVDQMGFDVGVHGIEYDSLQEMKEEHDAFSAIIGRNDFGIRMHYVRYSDNTFKYLDECGYVFDTTEFDKKRGYLFKNPYKVGSMWEFPLAIMDGYLPISYRQKIEKTEQLIKDAEAEGIEYLTVLFHDYQFCEGYATERDWYKWTIDYLSKRYEFISYKDAINELER